MNASKAKKEALEKKAVLNHKRVHKITYNFSFSIRYAIHQVKNSFLICTGNINLIDSPSMIKATSSINGHEKLALITVSTIRVLLQERILIRPDLEFTKTHVHSRNKIASIGHSGRSSSEFSGTGARMAAD